MTVTSIPAKLTFACDLCDIEQTIEATTPSIRPDGWCWLRLDAFRAVLSQAWVLCPACAGSVVSYMTVKKPPGGFT
jgi:hypothetical protein